MILIACLGNPGLQYRGTRHNVGFSVAEKLAARWGVRVGTRGFFGLYGTVNLFGEKVVLLQPQTYMNDSGRSVEALRRYFGIPLEQVWVVYDDIDLEEGRLRIRKSGSAGTHNGMRSIVKELGSTEFPRLRVGVGRPPEGWDLVDYVLGKPTPEGREKLDAAFERAADALEAMIRDGADAAMRIANI